MGLHCLTCSLGLRTAVFVWHFRLELEDERGLDFATRLVELLRGLRHGARTSLEPTSVRLGSKRGPGRRIFELRLVEGTSMLVAGVRLRDERCLAFYSEFRRRPGLAES
jgi:hypothetical protein